MTDIEQFANSLYSLKKQEEFDININIPVIDSAYYECLNMNKIICDTNHNPIVFDNSRLIFPHITIKMGTVKRNAFESVLKKMDLFTKNMKAISIVPQPIIIKEPAKKYYFSEILNDELLKISSELNDILKEEMTEPRFALSKDNLHHITLGYKFPDDLKLASVIGQTISSFVADRIQISIMGKFGVCIGVIKTFYLKKS